jgi:GTPase involved in cell partitioning and DNA repair
MDVRAHRRLYTRAQIEGMVEIASEEGILTNTARHITRTKFTERVLDQWHKEGWF